MIGPFKHPPFETFRISPIGVATRKYSAKKHLITDLSSPHKSETPSINSLIPAKDFSMQYVTIDHAISLICLAGRGAWLAKADIVNASPKIFDSLFEGLCWILVNNFKLPYVLHLLGDFLVVTPSSPPHYEVQNLGSALGVPSDAGPTVFGRFPVDSDLAHLASAAQLAILDGFAPRTLSAYLAGWTRFQSFLQTFHLPLTAADISTICSFISYNRTTKRVRTTSILTHLTSINFFYKLATGFPHPARGHANVTTLLKGLRKSEPHPPPKRQPLTTDLLLRCALVLRSGCIAPAFDLSLECMFLLAFFGFLRCSEFAPSSSAFDPTFHPTLSDVVRHSEDLFVFTLRRSKTDQIGASFPIYLFRLNSPLSPNDPRTKYLAARYASNASFSDPLFLTETGQMATRFWFSAHFRNVLRLSGAPGRFSIHSFRNGAATSAARAGIPDRVIQVLGRWASISYRNYIRHNIEDFR
ncbi:hypothetical protein WMY93_002040 [Mugilogobius chulae]|uniref:Tyr recombinase domain-containing protein n=1 Tax=Mugilogobius chulae TaxID=88201 RepID=A0AAW0Q3L8_9GOBI